MRIALPQLPRILEPLTGLAELVASDETVSTAVIRHEDITGLVTRSFSASEVKFERINATQAQLVRTGFSDVELAACELIATALPESSWRRVHIKESRCSGIQLQNSTLKDVTFTGCKLNMANFRFAELFNAVFVDCALDEADFYGASLHNVQFKNCTLAKTQFSSARLKQADLRTSDISGVLGIGSLAGAIIDSMQLVHLAPMLAAELRITVADD